VKRHLLRVARALMAAAVLALAASAADAQTTLVLASEQQVSDATIRGGAYATANISAGAIATSAGATADDTRRGLLKFDTETTIPAGTRITSATLRVTVRSGLGTGTRPIDIHRVSTSFLEGSVTWLLRKTGYAWGVLGGDYAGRYAHADVPAAAGTTFSLDVTALVQETVNGIHGSRYTRIALIDTGAASASSLREFHSSESLEVTARPQLKVVWGTAATSAPLPPPPPPPLPTLKVFHWNIRHGFDIAKQPNLDRVTTLIAQTGADLVSLNEVELYTGWGYQNQPAILEAQLEQKTGKAWYRYFAQRWAQWGSNGQGNLILSVHPFVSASGLDMSYSRSGAQATIVVGGRNVTFLSVHLSNESAAYRTVQIAELIAFAKGFAEPRIIAGDFNASPGAELASMTAAYSDSWAAGVAAGTAISFPGNPNGYTFGLSKRIDYLFKAGASLTLRTISVLDTRNASGMFTSDHNPIVAVYEMR
jgi:endonuclease/exonuclease/phosphatase family metal-dependent hydrolase